VYSVTLSLYLLVSCSVFLQFAIKSIGAIPEFITLILPEPVFSSLVLL
jgi:hypothetical protein